MRQGGIAVRKESLIVKVRDKFRDRDHDDHIAQVTGLRRVPVPAHYRHIETGDEFYDISGALAWPAADSPGFGVIVGVKKAGDPQEPALETLAEFESPSVEGLLKACCEIRGRWGFPEVLGVWLADQERFSPIVTDFNHSRKALDAFIVSPPYDFERPNRTEVYLQRIFELLRPGRGGEKRLFLGGCSRLQACLRDLPHDAAQRCQIEQWPAAAALGYAVHTLLVLKPWIVFLKHRRLVGTRGDQDDSFLGLPMHEQREVMELLNMVDIEDAGEHGGLINTL
jgi:hypothetical protein